MVDVVGQNCNLSSEEIKIDFLVKKSSTMFGRDDAIKTTFQNAY